MAIHVLDKHTAELIAAGEVVERPASVVKELLENAIDAGARHVTVEIRRGGVESLSVRDDGRGIETEDIPKAFLRHATSKVRTAEDLESIATLGFRGEALASIASVARVELLTCTARDEFASLYRIEGGEALDLEPAARAVGTTITVRDLFYNTPARMKFLKKDASEAAYVTETVTRIALSHPEVAVRYIREGRPVFATPGDGDVQSAAWAVLGADFARELERVRHTGGQYTVDGYITPPRAARASRSMQFFFINGRFVKNRTMMAALEQAYRGMLMGGRFPGCVLCLNMPPQLVDVNVHPAKIEVRFAREKDVFDAVYGAVKSALLQASAAHSHFVLGETASPDDAQRKPEDEQAPAAPAPFRVPTPASAPATEEMRPGFPLPIRPVPPPKPADEDARALYSRPVETLASEPAAAVYERAARPPVPSWLGGTPKACGEAALDVEPEEETAEAPAPPRQTSFAETEAANAAPALRLVGEVFRTYILAQYGEVLCVIDKHAAHERMIYESLVAARGKADSQQLLQPVTVALGADEKNALLQNPEPLAAAGIEVEDFGGNAVVVRGVPADVEPDSVSDLVVEVARRLSLNSRDGMNEKTEWVLHSVSCRAAMKAGDKTGAADLLALAARILDGSVPPFCPHGRPVVLEIPRKELEKQFGRLG